jgi:hypothetical protein
LTVTLKERFDFIQQVAYVLIGIHRDPPHARPPPPHFVTFLCRHFLTFFRYVYTVFSNRLNYKLLQQVKKRTVKRKYTR